MKVNGLACCLSVSTNQYKAANDRKQAKDEPPNAFYDTKHACVSPSQYTTTIGSVKQKNVGTTYL